VKKITNFEALCQCVENELCRREFKMRLVVGTK